MEGFDIQIEWLIGAIAFALYVRYEIDGIKTSICLLYTSPSPRDRTRSRMPSSA